LLALINLVIKRPKSRQVEIWGTPTNWSVPLSVLDQATVDVDYIKFAYLISLFTHWKCASEEYSRNSDHSDSMLVLRLVSPWAL